MSTYYKPFYFQITSLFKIAETHFPQLFIRIIFNFCLCYTAVVGQAYIFCIPLPLFQGLAARIQDPSPTGQAA